MGLRMKILIWGSLKNPIFTGWLHKTNIKKRLPKKGGLGSFIDLRGEGTLSKGERRMNACLLINLSLLINVFVISLCKASVATIKSYFSVLSLQSQLLAFNLNPLQQQNFNYQLSVPLVTSIQLEVINCNTSVPGLQSQAFLCNTSV